MLDLMPQVGKQPTYFSVAAFVKHHFQQRRCLAPALDLHVLRVGDAFRQMDAAVELGNDLAFNLPSHLNLINLLNAMAGVRETVGQRTIVGEEDQSFAGHVESADGKHSWRVGWQEIDHAGAACRITRG